GLADRIDLRLGPALDTLAGLGGGEPFDFAFIDADKTSYPAYWEAVVELLRPGAIAVVDNVLYDGEVVTPRSEDDGPPALRPRAGRAERRAGRGAILRTNELLASDERVESVMVGAADGITIALRR